MKKAKPLLVIFSFIFFIFICISAKFVNFNKKKSSNCAFPPYQQKLISYEQKTFSPTKVAYLAPTFVDFKKEKPIFKPEKFTTFLKTHISKHKKINAQKLQLKLIDSQIDALGKQHHRYQQYEQGIAVEGGIYIAHTDKKGYLESMNGQLFDVKNIDVTPNVDEGRAIELALQLAHADTYRWEVENLHKYFPKAKLVIVPNEFDFEKGGFQLAYKIEIYATRPLEKTVFYANAESGIIIAERPSLCTADAIGTAETFYSGTQQLHTDSLAPTAFRLRDYSRGKGIETYNLQQKTAFEQAQDFTDSDNYWNNQNAAQDEVATDVHWAIQKTYDYFLNTHNRNSYDNQATVIRSYVHYDSGYRNAFWDGEHLAFGDGDGSTRTPLTALEVCAHEYTHAITEYTANLFLSGESGALNESFSDIFGQVIEFQYKAETATYLLGDEITVNGEGLRSMNNPKTHGNPDTYGGEFWENDNNHNRSGVQNFWFYLLANGGTGANDLGNTYEVQSIGLQDAAAIAYRTLTVYLTPTSNYQDARFYSILAARDLFGDCSKQVEQTIRAWYAVGVGDNYAPQVRPDFIADRNNLCNLPATVRFSNTSINSTSVLWDFGDGNTSTEDKPTHHYQTGGHKDVSLIAYGCDGIADTIIKNNFIFIDTTSILCDTILFPFKEHQLITNCSGVLYDNGGQEHNYSNTATGSVTIQVAGSDYISLTIKDFSTEKDKDYLTIYDGNSIEAPLIGQYSGDDLPNNGQPIQSTGNTITLQFKSNTVVDETGFEIHWICHTVTEVPTVSFEQSASNLCDGKIFFQENSSNLPTQWHWDFGDGNTSTEQHPQHTYTQTGVYDVRLIACNNFGCDTLQKPHSINIQLKSLLCDTIYFEKNQHKNIHSCTGVIYDDGGSALPYSDNQQSSLTIAPPLAESITLHIQELDLQICCDSLLIYDGTDATAPLLFSSKQNDSTHEIIAQSGQVYLQFSSNQNIYESGFSIFYKTQAPLLAPSADFYLGADTFSLNQFLPIQNVSQRASAYWWNFGDGYFSTDFAPKHAYTQAGNYIVQMIAFNCYNSDTIYQEIEIVNPAQLLVEPNSLLIHLQTGEQQTHNVQLINTGDDYLKYTVQTTDLQDYDYQSTLNYSDLEPSTTHIFTPIAAYDSLVVTVTLNGDYNSNSEFASLYIDDEWIAQIDDQNISNGTDVQQIFTFTKETFAKWLIDKELVVKIRNDESVDEEGQQQHSVRVQANKIPWMRVEATPFTQIPPQDSSTILLHFNAIDIPTGIYNYSLPITTNVPDVPIYELFCQLVVSDGTTTGNAPIADFRLRKTENNNPYVISFFDASENEPSSWQWDFGDGNTSTEQHPLHTYHQKGIFDVSLTVCNDWGCDTKMKERYIRLGLDTPLNESRFDKQSTPTQNASYTLFPNPANTQLNIHFSQKTNQNTPIHLQLFNNLGQIVVQQKLSPPLPATYQLPLEYLPKGVYYLSLKMDGGSWVEKVVIF